MGLIQDNLQYSILSPQCNSLAHWCVFISFWTTMERHNTKQWDASGFGYTDNTCSFDQFISGFSIFIRFGENYNNANYQTTYYCYSDMCWCRNTLTLSLSHPSFHFLSNSLALLSQPALCQECFTSASPGHRRWLRCGFKNVCLCKYLAAPWCVPVGKCHCVAK